MSSCLYNAQMCTVWILSIERNDVSMRRYSIRRAEYRQHFYDHDYQCTCCAEGLFLVCGNYVYNPNVCCFNRSPSIVVIC